MRDWICIEDGFWVLRRKRASIRLEPTGLVVRVNNAVVGTGRTVTQAEAIAEAQVRADEQQGSGR